MPSETFHRLTEDKKNKLINAALKEFSRVPYHEASINVIIDDAKISRGSFYMYFKDKEDIYRYILYSYKEKFLKTINDNFDKYDGDIKETFYHIFTDITEYIRKTNYQLFFKNVFSSLNIKNEDFIIPSHKEICHHEKIEAMYKKVNTKNLNITEDELDYVFEIIMNITIPSIIKSILSEQETDKINEIYLKKLEIISKGLYRREVK